MFHYRLAATNNRSRMLIAALVALVVHIGLMNFEFTPKQILVPSVSLPRSVSIFLRQSSKVQTPDKPVKKVQEVKHIQEELFKTKKEPETPAVNEPDSSFQSPTIFEKTVKQLTGIEKVESKPSIENIVPVYQEPEKATESLKPAASEVSSIPKINTQEEEGVILPGTLQMAYPRYQLNTPPAYPGLARKRGQEGTVVLQVLVSRTGRVDDLKIDDSSNFTLLDRAAVSAVRKWKFEPGKQGKEKIPMWVRVPVTFKLK
jgi:protein TonB